jgi:acetylornithine deacetylase/succinyl-diaminopimelate desuccinylase-like protein
LIWSRVLIRREIFLERELDLLQNLKPILFGSHIDSVPSGGNFDGDLGSMSAIE